MAYTLITDDADVPSTYTPNNSSSYIAHKGPIIDEDGVNWMPLSMCDPSSPDFLPWYEAIKHQLPNPINLGI